jgi:hypothetical protein
MDAIAKWINDCEDRNRQQGERLAAEILAAVMAGDALPDEWYTVDTYADVGDPDSARVAEIVRDELSTTPVRV